MLSHPLTQLGAVIAAGGWLFLLLGTGIDTDVPRMPAIFNIHLGTIANNTILLGYALAIIGTIARLGDRLAPSQAIEAEAPLAALLNAEIETSTPAAPRSDDDLAKRAAALRASLSTAR